MSRAVDQFMANEGVVISRRLVDRELNKISRFHGPTGKFDPNVFAGVLAENKLTEDDVRGQFARQIFARSVEVPAGAVPYVPATATGAYARVQLESRQGRIVMLSAEQFAGGAAPSDADVKQFYAANAARYTVPETRVLRYAIIAPDRFKGKVQPSETEIAAAYKANAARFSTKETRVLTQVIVPTDAAAKTVAKAGAAGFLAAAKTAGGSPTTLKPLDKAGYAAIATAPAVADAAFAAAEGSVVQAGKSSLGFHVVKVDKVSVTGGKSQEAARAELLPDLITLKEAEALQDFIGKVEAAVDDGAPLADVAKAQGLALVATPAITASGVAPADPGYKLPADIAPLLKEAFTAELGDDPLVGALDAKSGLSALYELGAVNRAAPRPLDAIRDQVAKDFVADRAAKAAKKAANAALAKINKGMAFDAALASENIGGARAITGKRTDLQGDPAKLPTGLAPLFELARGKARLIELPGRSGYALVTLDKIVPGAPQGDPQLVSMLQRQLEMQAASEYAEQFFSAVSQGLGGARDAERIAKLKRSITSPAGQ